MNRDIKINYNDKVYNTLSRFISYFHQIDLIRKYKPNSVLEIGIGSKIVSQHIQNINIKITTCDINKELSPDIVADVRDLNLQDNSFDMVCACEILEHIPFADFEKTIQKLKNISKEYILISLPYPSIAFDFVIKIPSWKRKIKKQIFGFRIRIPLFFTKPKYDGDHYWEIGKKGLPLHKIRNILKKHLTLVEERRPILDHYHVYFMLKK